ncbi:transporter [uncultured Gelidibacter sp.]|uniref:transporter n=1 Tax=uncultured Gelidibacter sp. TaxID=259318 RepID=UPI00262081D1|nr:transporter [uncultured Gelidibacter sp.]
MKSNKKHIAVINFIVGSCSLFAQEDTTLTVPLITDRPDARESPTAMPKGILQIETGSFYESYEKNSIKKEAFTYNTTLLRYGLLNNLELRVGWNFEEQTVHINGNKLKDVNSGFHPLLLGFKTTIAQANGWLPEIGFLSHLYLPFMASTDYKPETTGANFLFAFNHTLSEKSNLGYNIGAAWNNDSPEIAYTYAIAYGYGITDKLGMYTELYGNFPENSTANHFWDAGLTYLISYNVQLDASVGTSITNGQDLLVSAGASFRTPTQKQIR